jgi:hypothetical protein
VFSSDCCGHHDAIVAPGAKGNGARRAYAPALVKANNSPRNAFARSRFR